MPLHPPPASGSGSSLAKEHVAEEHVRVGVAERCSAACAGARPASGSVVGPLGPARRRVTQVRISSSERLLHLRSGARRDARALAPDQSTRMVCNTTKLCPRSDRNWPLAPRGLCDLFDRDSLCGSLLELDPARAHACPHMQPAPPRGAHTARPRPRILKFPHIAVSRHVANCLHDWNGTPQPREDMSRLRLRHRKSEAM